MIRRYRKVSFVILLIINWITFSQSKAAEITGTVTDPENNPLVGANVSLKGTILGSATNSRGEYIISNVPAGDYILSIYFVGYSQVDIPLNIAAGKSQDVGKVILTPTPITFDPIIVTASKYEQSIQDVPLSISNINEKEIRYRNSITFGDALKYVPGVNLNGSQVNIRGSSGFSYAVGSRVLLLVDGVPLLTGDTGEIIFESVPIHLVERMEVQKSAGSALYGSNALGGVINLITRDIDYSPQLYVRVFGGLYSEPYHKEWKWSDDNRFLNGLNINYAKKINKVGFMLGGSTFEDDSYRENDSRQRYTVNGNLKWEISPFQRLALNGNYMYQKRRSFLWWRGLRNALRPPSDQLDDEVESKRYYINGHYRHIINQSQYLTIRGIWYGNKFEDTTEQDGNKSTANSFDGEVQYNRQLGKHLLTGGAQGTANFISSNLFGNTSSSYTGLYIQDEIDFSYRFKTTIGARFDYSYIKEVGSNSRINPKLALVYKGFAGNALRASIGTGFRPPSLAEVFTSTSLSGLLVIPNTDSLKAERSLSLEFGTNQIVAGWLEFDISFFQNDYWDLIEASLVEEDGLVTGEVQFQNVSRARIRGFEVSANSNFFRRFLNLGAGYTYVDPRDLENNEYLKFRPRHLFYGNGRINFLAFQLGVDYRFISRFDNIEDLLTRIIRDADKQADAHIVDLRLSTGFLLFQQLAQVSLHINNLLQYHYVDAVGSLAPIRNFVLAFEVGI
jgi:iron complex outermembrane receptor protein